MLDVFIVDASSYDEVQQQLLKFKENIRIVQTYQPRSPANNLDNKNGNIDASDHSTGTSTPPQPLQQQQQPLPHPPAVSVVTFRWDDEIQINSTHKIRKRAR